MPFQACPNCKQRHDVAVYVHGQQTRCSSCGLRFTVNREEEAPARTPTPPPAAAAAVDGQTDVTRPAAPAPAPPTPQPSPEAPKHGAAPPVINAIPATDAKPVIPGYEVLSLLGKGGMGEVWKARQNSLKRIVAVKVLSPTLAVEPDFVRRFERESSALAALGHAHVVQVFDRGSANGLWYFTMEFVDGRTLRDKHAESPLPRVEILRILSQVARAMDYAHQKNVIHRDLKPENILLDVQNNAKVADFGLANMSESGVSALTMTAVAMGTAHYMAPEQRKDAKNVDFRADLFSLGVMLYELLTGELPVGRFKTPKEKVPDLDPRLDDIIMKLLDPEPTRRPKRALEVAAAIDSSLLGPRMGGPVDVPMGGRARFEPAKLNGGRRLRRSRRPLLYAVAGVAVALGLAIWWAWPKARGQKLAARLETADARTSIAFGAGESGAFVAYGSGWTSKPAGLERSAVKDADRDERAYLARPLATGDATVELEVESGSAGGEGAEVVLVSHPERLAGLRLAEGKARLVGAANGKPAEVALDPNLRTHRVVLQTEGAKLTASVDGRPVGSASLPDGRAAQFVGVGCVGAPCRFSAWRLGAEPGEPDRQAFAAATER
ncbi:MAG: hypothetical protein RL199_435 [Pseudomonadota bacterium]|jgi:serine/threonine-protein kinase